MGRYLLGRKKLSKSGGSLKVVIPMSVVKRLGLEAGDEVELVFDPTRGNVIIKFLEKEDDKNEKK